MFNGFRETSEARIDLKASTTDPSCDRPDAVHFMVEFMYMLNYGAKYVEANDADPDPASEVADGVIDHEEDDVEEAVELDDNADDWEDVESEDEGFGEEDANMLVHVRVYAIAIK